MKSKVVREAISHEQYVDFCESIVTGIQAVFEIQEPHIAYQTLFPNVTTGRALELARTYQLDFVDVYQLVVIEWLINEELKNMAGSVECVFITADKDLATAARLENIRVWDCLREDSP